LFLGQRKSHSAATVLLSGALPAVAFLLLNSLSELHCTQSAQKNAARRIMRIAKQIFMMGLLGIALSACSPAFWGGAAAGTLATGGGYEINNKRQMDQLDDDYRSGRIDQNEYNQRKHQIESGSIIY